MPNQPYSSVTHPTRATRADLVSTLRTAGCVFAEDEAELLLTSAPTPEALSAMVERRTAGEPLEHVLGWAEFDGVRVLVEPGVFVPRRRTEFLVDQAHALGGPGAVVVDLCCGSGAVGAALAARWGELELYAVDVEPAAVRCARRNLASTGAYVGEGDLYDPLPATLRGRVDLLVVNAPYVPTDALELLPAEARDHEPRVALDGGTRGLDVQRRVTAEAARWLAPAGHLLMETSERQAPCTAADFTRSGLTARMASCEERAATVVLGGRRSEPA